MSSSSAPTAELSPLTQPGSRWTTPVLVSLFIIAVFLPAYFFADNQFRLILLSRCATLAILALGVDLIWGYTGLLSLGQALYFGLGAYIVAYSLKLRQAAFDFNAATLENHLPGTVPPDFMLYTGQAPNTPGYVEPPALVWIAPLANIWVALAVAFVLPMVVAFLFGLISFRRKIRGVYFSLITQAMVLAMFLFVDNQQAYTGGRPGINGVAHLEIAGFTFHRFKSREILEKEANREWQALERLAETSPQEYEEKFSQKFAGVFGSPVYRVRSMFDFYLLIATIVVLCYLLCLFLVSSKFGKILTAIRDNEHRVLALGYNTAMYKLFAFVVAAGLAGLGGFFFVPVVGKMGPSYIDVATSIEVVVFVAVGGRGTLVGAVFGTFLVHYGTSYIGEIAREWRPVILGLLFVGVVVFMPKGVLGLAESAWARLRRMLSRSSPTAA